MASKSETAFQPTFHIDRMFLNQKHCYQLLSETPSSTSGDTPAQQKKHPL